MTGRFKNIIEQHNGILYKVGRSYTRTEQDFEDLYQEILIQLWQSIKRFREESKLSTFIYKVALNTAITFSEKSRRKNPPINAAAMLTTAVEADPLRKEQASRQQSRIDLLYRCINLLEKDDRAIILLHLEGQSYEETADILGITTNHVGVKLNRVKKKLYKLLNEYGYAAI